MVIHGKTKMSPGITGGYEVLKFESYPITDSKKKTMFSSARTKTRVTSPSGKVKELVRIDSYHDYEICNTDSYPIYFPLYVSVSDSLNNENTNFDHVLIQPNTCSKGLTNLFFNATYEKAGTYQAYASTSVDNQAKTKDQKSIRIFK
jgi:hypothetical protein